jgi:hypothetical protein
MKSQRNDEKVNNGIPTNFTIVKFGLNSRAKTHSRGFRSMHGDKLIEATDSQRKRFPRFEEVQNSIQMFPSKASGNEKKNDLRRITIDRPIRTVEFRSNTRTIDAPLKSSRKDPENDFPHR